MGAAGGSNIPFTVEDIASSMEDLEITDVPLPASLSEVPAFAFLREGSKPAALAAGGHGGGAHAAAGGVAHAQH